MYNDGSHDNIAQLFWRGENPELGDVAAIVV